MNIALYIRAETLYARTCVCIHDVRHTWVCWHGNPSHRTRISPLFDAIWYGWNGAAQRLAATQHQDRLSNYLYGKHSVCCCCWCCMYAENTMITWIDGTALNLIDSCFPSLDRKWFNYRLLNLHRFTYTVLNGDIDFVRLLSLWILRTSNISRVYMRPN